MYLSQPHFQEFNRDGTPIKAAGAEGPSWIPAITGVGGEGSALYKTQEPSMIYSEKRSGLRMDYTEKYQLNVRIPKNVWGTLNTYAEDCITLSSGRSGHQSALEQRRRLNAGSG